MDWKGAKPEIFKFKKKKKIFLFQNYFGHSLPISFYITFRVSLQVYMKMPAETL